jgi:hypothetical protein
MDVQKGDSAMTTVWHPAALSAVGGSALALAVALLALVRRIGVDHAGREALERRLDDLSLRLRAIESLTASAPAPTTRRADPPGTAPARGPTLIAVPSIAADGSAAAASEAAAEFRRRFAPIWERAEAGERPDAIARATGHPIGQVELILGLRRPVGPGRSVPHG